MCSNLPWAVKDGCHLLEKELLIQQPQRLTIHNEQRRRDLVLWLLHDLLLPLLEGLLFPKASHIQHVKPLTLGCSALKAAFALWSIVQNAGLLPFPVCRSINLSWIYLLLMKRYALTDLRRVASINPFWVFILVCVCYFRLRAFLYVWFDLVDELLEQFQLLGVVCDVGFCHFLLLKVLLIWCLCWNLWKLCFNQYWMIMWIIAVSLHFNFFNDIEIGIYAHLALTDGRLVGVIG